MISAIIFDCDGVLVDSEVLALEVELAILADQGLNFEREDYVTRFMGLSHEAFHDVIDAEAQKRIGRPISDTIREELARRLRQTMIARLTAVPGAVAAVSGTSLLKAVASSSTKEGLERKLRQVGLWSHFEPHVYSADHVANAKPAPDLFLHAAEKLGVRPDECLVLEDSVNGVVAGRAAGMRVWGFLGGGHVHDRQFQDRFGARLNQAGAERLVRDWPEAARLLAGLRGSKPGNSP
ncbi:MAG TPA: HAD family hydrolase [Rhizomicrobium sp.]|nr:HAD family hydrolase [Rhizomicrobium sp.]